MVGSPSDHLQDAALKAWQRGPRVVIWDGRKKPQKLCVLESRGYRWKLKMDPCKKRFLVNQKSACWGSMLNLNGVEGWMAVIRKITCFDLKCFFFLGNLWQANWNAVQNQFLWAAICEDQIHVYWVRAVRDQTASPDKSTSSFASERRPTLRFIVAAILQQLKVIIQVVYPTASYGIYHICFFWGRAIPSSMWRNYPWECKKLSFRCWWNMIKLIHIHNRLPSIFGNGYTPTRLNRK